MKWGDGRGAWKVRLSAAELSTVRGNETGQFIRISQTMALKPTLKHGNSGPRG